MLFYVLKFCYYSRWNLLLNYIGINFNYLISNHCLRFINRSYISMSAFLETLKNSKSSLLYNTSYKNDLFITSYSSQSYADSKDYFLCFSVEGRQSSKRTFFMIKIQYSISSTYYYNYYIYLKKSIAYLFSNILCNYFSSLFIYNKYSSTLLYQSNNWIDRHSLLYTNVYKFVDDFKLFGLEDYSLKFDYFSETKIRNFFTIRYGLGFFVSNLICKYLGISNQMLLSNLVNYWEYSSGHRFFDQYSNILDQNLWLYVLSRHKALIGLNHRKGLRLLNGYPINGQRTRSNAKTASKFPYKLKFKSNV